MKCFLLFKQKTAGEMLISDWSSDVCSSELNGFSYPTTSAMAFFRSTYPMDYKPILRAKRVDNNGHIRPIKDGIRFLLIIFKIATLYSPLKLFAPVAMAFAAAGLGWYGWTF